MRAKIIINETDPDKRLAIFNRIIAGLKRKMEKAHLYKSSANFKIEDKNIIIFEFHIPNENMPLFGKKAQNMIFEAFKSQINEIPGNILVERLKE